MTSNEEIVRAAYHAAEGSVMDLEGWRNSFTEDGVFNMIPTGESYTGEKLNDVVTFVAGAFPDVHRELLRVNAMGDAEASSRHGAQRALHFATADRQWVVTAYTSRWSDSRSPC